MKENERLKALEKIKILQKKREEHLALKKEFEELIKDSKVKRAIYLSRYLHLNEDNKIRNAETEEEIEAFAFNSSVNHEECLHDIWVYVGSYYSKRNYYDHVYSIVQIPNEQDKRFEYNIYTCLDCSESIEIKDYKKFESEHQVLKNYEFTDIKKLRKIYFQLLRTFDNESASKKLIKEFKERY